MTCDYCEEGNVPVNGWHYYYDDMDESGYRVPCATKEEES